MAIVKALISVTLFNSFLTGVIFFKSFAQNIEDTKIKAYLSKQCNEQPSSMSDDQIIMIQNMLDDIAKGPNTQNLVDVTAYTAKDNLKTTIRVINGKNSEIGAFAFLPESIKKDALTRRRFFTPEYLKTMPNDKHDILVATKVPSHKWVTIAKSEVDEKNGGSVSMFINNTGNSDFKIKYVLNGKKMSDTLASGRMPFVVEKSADGKNWQLFYVNPNLEKIPFNKLDLNVPLHFWHVGQISSIEIRQD